MEVSPYIKTLYHYNSKLMPVADMHKASRTKVPLKRLRDRLARHMDYRRALTLPRYSYAKPNYPTRVIELTDEQKRGLDIRQSLVVVVEFIVTDYITIGIQPAGVLVGVDTSLLSGELESYVMMRGDNVLEAFCLT